MSMNNLLRIMGIVITVFGVMLSFTNSLSSIICLLLGSALIIYYGDKIARSKSLTPKPVYKRKWVYVIIVLFLFGTYNKMSTVPVDKLSIVNPADTTMDIDETQEITINISPSDATASSITLCSSDENVVTFTTDENIEDGAIKATLTAVGEGNATIYAQTPDGSITSGEISVNVEDSARIEKERKLAEEKAKLKAEQEAAEQQAQQEAKAAEEEAQRQAAEQEAQRQAAEEQARINAEAQQNPTPPVTSTPSTPAATSPDTNAPTVNTESGRTVYYTNSGSKYHYENPCGRGTYYPCTLAEAEAMGLAPCEKCVLH